jgi:hypothetical protein
MEAPPTRRRHVVEFRRMYSSTSQQLIKQLIHHMMNACHRISFCQPRRPLRGPGFYETNDRDYRAARTSFQRTSASSTTLRTPPGPLGPREQRDERADIFNVDPFTGKPTLSGEPHTVVNRCHLPTELEMRELRTPRLGSQSTGKVYQCRISRAPENPIQRVLISTQPHSIYIVQTYCIQHSRIVDFSVNSWIFRDLAVGGA